MVPKAKKNRSTTRYFEELPSLEAKRRRRSEKVAQEVGLAIP
jgi:hypothetical protein